MMFFLASYILQYNINKKTYTISIVINRVVQFTELNLFKHLAHLTLVLLKATDTQLKVIPGPSHPGPAQGYGHSTQGNT